MPKKESKRNSPKKKERRASSTPRKATLEQQPRTVPTSGQYFCRICLVAFDEQSKLDEHLKSHRELEVTPEACKMEAQPAGVF